MKTTTLLLALILVLPGTSLAKERDKSNEEIKMDKEYLTFEMNKNVIKESVEYQNRYGITVGAHLYISKDLDKSKSYPALLVGTPYGGVKEQGAGIYAMNMAQRGFVAIAFDESYNGTSGGEPRRSSSPDIFVEDFSAGVDYLGTLPYVDREQIGAIGICGSGAFSLTAAQTDHRIKAVATASMYDMSRFKRYGWMDAMSDKERNDHLEMVAKQRWADVDKGEPALTPAFPPVPAESVPKGLDPITAEFFEYYAMKRGFHPNSIAVFTITSDTAFMNFPLLNYIETISPRPILFIMGENAHSRYFTEDAYKRAAEPKELVIVPGARHIDLYDRVDMIPFDTMATFFRENLKKEYTGQYGFENNSPDAEHLFKEVVKVPNETFTGDVYLSMLVTDQEQKYDTQVYNVTFRNRARTHWHTHEGGQILVVTKGTGFYQEKGKPAQVLKVGDVVEIPAHVNHWHGVADEGTFVHLGMSTRTDKGPVAWLGEVTDEQFESALNDKNGN